VSMRVEPFSPLDESPALGVPSAALLSE
jgi:hypothetical protein